MPIRGSVCHFTQPYFLEKTMIINNNENTHKLMERTEDPKYAETEHSS